MSNRTMIGRQHIDPLLTQPTTHRHAVVTHSIHLALLYIHPRTHPLPLLSLLQVTVPTAIEIDPTASLLLITLLSMVLQLLIERVAHDGSRGIVVHQRDSLLE